MIKDPIRLIGTTTAGGAATLTSEYAVLGLLYAVEWVDGTLDDNNTAVLSVVQTDSGVDQAVHTQVAGEGDDDVWYYPRALAQDLSAVDLTATYAYPVVNGYLQLVIAAGGNAATGGCIVYVLS